MHLGGVSTERPFEEVLDPNIRGVFHVYEAARRHGVKRVVFASSNHVIGFYKQGRHLDVDARRRPDGYYGLSKSFGEDVANFYFDRYGIESVSIRIGSAFPEPTNRRMLCTWLSYRDLTQLVGLFAVRAERRPHGGLRGLGQPRRVVGQRAPRRGSASSPKTAPRRSAPASRPQPAPAPDDPLMVYQGGAFTALGPFGD